MSYSIEDIIPHLLWNPALVTGTVDNFFSEFDVQDLIEQAGGDKRSGAPGGEIIKYVLNLRLINQTIYSNERGDYFDSPCKKTSVYDYFARPGIDWNLLLGLVVKNVIDDLEATYGEDGAAMRPAIFDDTDKPRDYSENTELVAWQRRHAGKGKRNFKGYKELIMGVEYKGVYFPVSMSLHASSNIPEGCEPDGDCPEGSPGARRREWAAMKKTVRHAQMAEECLNLGFACTHALCDSWFGEPRTVLRLRDKGLDVVAAVKQNGPSRYRYRDTGEWLTVREIFERERALHGDDSDDPVFYDVPVLCRRDGVTWPARILLFDNVHEDRDYFSMVCTDLRISSLAAKRLYDRRFDCEFCHRDEKNATTIRTETSCQCQNFDSVYAFAILDLILYVILARQLLIDRLGDGDGDSGDGDGASVESEFRGASAELFWNSALVASLKVANELLGAVSAACRLDRGELDRLATAVLAHSDSFAGCLERCVRLSKGRLAAMPGKRDGKRRGDRPQNSPGDPVPFPSEGAGSAGG